MGKRKIGRPTSYTEEVAEELFARLADGEPLRKICTDKHMPDAHTFFRWMKVQDGFIQRYDAAKQEAADMLVDEILMIADDTASDKHVNDDGREVYDRECVMRARLRVDSRKWIASKLKPKRYGDRIEVDNRGEVKISYKIEGESVGDGI